jgi:hypothetical protein
VLLKKTVLYQGLKGMDHWLIELLLQQASAKENQKFLFLAGIREVRAADVLPDSPWPTSPVNEV